ncbi:hypothetical protein WJ02_13240 [Burkholderia vietnamiensis]|nr:hypothetical protein WJ02_13240 [Burkholderia vietnamiensis]
MEAWFVTIEVYGLKDLSYRFDKVGFACPILSDKDGGQLLFVEVDVEIFEVFEAVDINFVKSHFVPP